MPDHIQVSTQALTEKEAEWLGLCRQIQGAFQAGMEEFEKVEQSFLAEPVQNVRQALLGLRAEGDAVFDRLYRHIEKLSEIAAVYETAERKNKDVCCED